jgi:hypothetical protein
MRATSVARAQYKTGLAETAKNAVDAFFHRHFVIFVDPKKSRA